jgi:hypothetical protein
VARQPPGEPGRDAGVEDDPHYRMARRR